MLCAVRKLNTIVQSSGEMACMQSKNARNGTSHASKLIHQIAVILYIFSTSCLIQCLPKDLRFSWLTAVEHGKTGNVLIV